MQIFLSFSSQAGMEKMREIPTKFMDCKSTGNFLSLSRQPVRSHSGEYINPSASQTKFLSCRPYQHKFQDSMKIRCGRAHLFTIAVFFSLKLYQNVSVFSNSEKYNSLHSFTEAGALSLLILHVRMASF